MSSQNFVSNYCFCSFVLSPTISRGFASRHLFFAVILVLLVWTNFKWGWIFIHYCQSSRHFEWSKWMNEILRFIVALAYLVIKVLIFYYYFEFRYNGRKSSGSIYQWNDIGMHWSSNQNDFANCFHFKKWGEGNHRCTKLCNKTTHSNSSSDLTVFI